MKWRYMHGQWSMLEDERGLEVASLSQDGAGWWWLHVPQQLPRRIWPTSRGQQRLRLTELYALAERELAPKDSAAHAAA